MLSAAELILVAFASKRHGRVGASYLVSRDRHQDPARSGGRQSPQLALRDLGDALLAARATKPLRRDDGNGKKNRSKPRVTRVVLAVLWHVFSGF